MIQCTVKSFCLLFLFISLFFGNQCKSEEKEHENQQSVITILQQLGIQSSSGQSNQNQKNSNTLPSTHSERLMEISELNGKFQDLFVKDPVSSFKAKYLFTKTARTNFTFEKLSQSSLAMKTYLIDLNNKLVNVAVLPRSVDEISDSSVLKKLNIVDADPEALEQDLRDSRKKRSFETKNKYKQNQLTFKVGKDRAYDVCEVSVEEKLKLAYTSIEEVRIRMDDDDDDAKPNAKKPVCTSFPEKQLNTIHDINLKFGNDLFLPPAMNSDENMDIVLNEDSAWYKEKMGKYWEQLENLVINPISKRGTALRDLESTCFVHDERNECAVKINKEEGDNVEAIYGNEFIVAYESSSREEKEQLTQVVKMNMEKVVLSSRDRKRIGSKENVAEELENVKRKIETIFNLEGFKRHASTVHYVTEIQDLKNKKGWTPSKIIDYISKLEHSKVTLSQSQVAEGIAKSRTYKNYKSSNFLASTEILGLNRGDDTTLNNIEKRLGYTPSQSTSEEQTKVLGRIASPIGSHQDNIGFNLYSISKNVERLDMSGDDYDKNDAIADIFLQALDIGTFSGVVAVSVSFPIAAPVAIATGAVIIGLNRLIISLYKTGNQVAAIHSQVALSFSEGWKAFWDRFREQFGRKRQRDYIDDLVSEKRANDLVVQRNLKFLKDNEDTIRGIIFPSREYIYDGGCELTKQACSQNASLSEETDESCAVEGPIELVGKGCELNGPCPTVNKPCKNYTEWNLQYTCQCTQKARNLFGAEKENSYVNLRDKRALFWERVVPKDVKNAEFICKPGRDSYVEHITESDKRKGIFSCKNAIGLLQPQDKRKDGQVMMIDLGNGPDYVILDPNNTIPNVFRMGQCGTKWFEGGGGKNEFLFEKDVCSSNLTATLVGGDSDEDTITLADDFSRGHQLSVNLGNGTMGSILEIERINVKFESVETFVGRSGESELVTVNCSTRTVALRGGHDEIIVPRNDSCDYNLTVVMNEYSNLTCSATTGEITLLAESNPNIPYPLFYATFNKFPNSSTKLNLMFLKVSSRHVVHKIKIDEENATLFLRQIVGNRRVDTAEITFRGHNLTEQEKESNMPLYFAEDPPDSPFSVMRISLNKKEATSVHHLLPPCNETDNLIKRYGSEAYRNVFEVSGTCWQIYGGNEMDEFLLTVQPDELHGGGNNDTVRIDTQADTEINFVLDLSSENFTGIENVVGSPHKNLEVTCGCDTKLVVLMGTNFPKQQNLAVIPNCERRTHSPLQVVAEGNSQVKVVGGVIGDFSTDGVGVIAVSSVDNGTSPPLTFEFEGGTENLAGLQLSLKLAHNNWTITKMETRDSEINVELHGMKTVNESIQLKLATSNSQNVWGSLLKFPSIYVLVGGKKKAPAGQFIFDMDTRDLKVLFNLEDNGNGETIQGLLGVPNIFRVSKPSWKIQGGNSNDVFFVDDSAVKGTHIDGGTGGENTLIIETALSTDDEETAFVVDLPEKHFGFSRFLRHQNGTFSSIHQVIGRPNLPDRIKTTCSTTMVNGRGGLSKEEQDVIEILEEKCVDPVQVTIDLSEKYVYLRNKATLGSFTYYVGDLRNSKLEITISDENRHTIVYMYQPWKIIKRVQLEKGNKLLAIFFVLDGETHKKTFTLARPNNITGEYTNPLIKFHHPDFSSLTTDIRVSKNNGIVSSTIFLNGMCLGTTDKVLGLPVHVNKFLINTTLTREPLYLSGGVIRVSVESESNLFWIFQLSGTLDILDGGKMSAKNCLHLTDSLFPKTDLVIDLDISNGFLKQNSTEKMLIRRIRNIVEFRGRSISSASDTVYVTCNTKSVALAENIYVRSDIYSSCSSYNLVIELGESTAVKFMARENQFAHESQVDLKHHVFHYNFSSARSFDVERDFNDFLLLSLATHIYYLPFYLDNITKVSFDFHKQLLSYSLFSSNITYSHRMLSPTLPTDQFYQQPVMITKDGFNIQVARTGNIQLSLDSSSKFSSLHYIQTQVIPVFLNTAKRIGATIILRTANEMLYFDKNVVQNSKNLTSHLVGSSESGTTYVIVSLTKDIYIYMAAGKRKETCVHSHQCPYQTLHLSEIISMIRQHGYYEEKFIPTVIEQETNLVIKMTGQEDKFPGKIVIVNGTYDWMRKRLEVLLDSTAMQLTKDGISWKLTPKAAGVQMGYTLGLSTSDFEQDQKIELKSNQQFDEHTAFYPAQNGPNLILSNIKQLEHVRKTRTKRDLSSKGMDISQDATTVVITDFFRNPLNGSTGSQTQQVTVSLPGLELMLNGGQILMWMPNKNEIVTDTRSSGEWVPLAAPQEWKCVLHDIEQKLLKKLPNMETIYYASECVDRTLMYALIAVSFVVAILGLCYLIYWIDWKLLVGRNKQENVPKEEEVLLRDNLIEKENMVGCDNLTEPVGDSPSLKPSAVVARPNYRYIYEDSEIRRLAAERVCRVNKLKKRGSVKSEVQI